MKPIIVFVLIIMATLTSKADNNPNVVIGKDTIFYKWNIKDYNPENDPWKILPFNKIIHYNGKMWLAGYNAYSTDNLNTWNGLDPFRSFGLVVKDFTLTANNKIIAVADSIVNYKSAWGNILIVDDLSKPARQIKLDIFKGNSLQKIIFKDSLNGILSDYLNALYSTSDGGESWERMDGFPNPFGKDTIFIHSLQYFGESNTLLVQIFNSSIKKEFLAISKDFGRTWSELRSFPRKIDYPKYYLRNDSLWISGASPTNHGAELYKYIYFSPDLGKTWEAQLLAFTETGFDYITSIAFFDNSAVGMACENTAKVMLTFDGGAHWTQILDEVTAFGDRYYTNYYDSLSKANRKYSMVKADNKMVFFGINKVFIFNNLNIPKSVSDGDKEEIYCEYENSTQEIEISSPSAYLINGFTIYDITGKTLYKSDAASNSPVRISSREIGTSRIVFVMINANGQVYLKRLLCE
ncbi:MAG: WD40/YVTN/BNR-like repeat-containing protein [Chloroflexota bacterium]